MEVPAGIIAAIVAAFVVGALCLSVGLSVGRSRGRAAGLEEGRSGVDARLRSVVEAVRRGRTPPNLTAGSPEAELQKALEQGWTPREAEREAALREAIGRVSRFLETSVRAPLTGFGENTSASELRERIDRALGALQDLDFFIAETSDAREGTDLAALAQRVSREFASDQSVGVRLSLSGIGIRATVNPQALMDALYLVLHNAARFGGGATVDLTVTEVDGRVKIVVRDRGEGFTEEAFRRAFDPFYSTSEEGLGLGLPHARKVLEGMGGRIELRNVPDGGAEVEISFQAA